MDSEKQNELVTTIEACASFDAVSPAESEMMKIVTNSFCFSLSIKKISLAISNNLLYIFFMDSEKQNELVTIFIISDSAGETASKLAQASI
jgi:uncharacterized membrane protein YjjP (DUF1212 family)